jgi:gas vesicle protein
MAMSDTLIGVILGGIIASITPVITLIINHKRWKREMKIEYLKEERRRLEKLYSETLEGLGEAMAKNSYPSQMTSDILILMPKSVSSIFNDWMKVEDKSKSKGQQTYMDIAVEMKKSLAAIDAQINELISN